jgi:hypothetical protein
MSHTELEIQGSSFHRSALADHRVSQRKVEFYPVAQLPSLVVCALAFEL